MLALGSICETPSGPSPPPNLRTPTGVSMVLPARSRDRQAQARTDEPAPQGVNETVREVHLSPRQLRPLALPSEQLTSSFSPLDSSA